MATSLVPLQGPTLGMGNPTGTKSPSRVRDGERMSPMMVHRDGDGDGERMSSAGTGMGA
jgi:hypothetical protein